MSNENPQVVDKRRFTKLDIEELPVVEAGGIPEAAIANVVNFSPSSQPSTSPGMDFGTALKQVLRGQPVTRLEWENPSIYLLLYRCRVPNFGVEDGNYLSIHRADGTVGPLFVSDNDLRADDWIVVV